jgi:hypothetical protein
MSRQPEKGRLETKKGTCASVIRLGGSWIVRSRRQRRSASVITDHAPISPADRDPLISNGSNRSPPDHAREPEGPDDGAAECGDGGDDDRKGGGLGGEAEARLQRLEELGNSGGEDRRAGHAVGTRLI